MLPQRITIRQGIDLMSRGVFISFEGGEGCGKSTQSLLLKAALEKEGHRVLLTREPGGTWLGEQVRKLIKDQSDDVPCARAETLLFLAARAQLVEKIIAPALDEGVWVITDRFIDSTIAYQGYGRGLDIAQLHRANEFACSSLKPDVTLLLDVEPKEAVLRRISREQKQHSSADRIEREGELFHSRLREGFAALAAEEPERFRVIDANGAVEEVQEKIWTSLKHLV